MSETVSAKWHSWRTPLTVAAAIAIVGGSPLAVWAWPPHDSASAIARFIYGNGARLPGVLSQVRGALCTEAWFIAGYGLLLGGCAVIFWVWAISKFGRLAAIYVLAGVMIAVLAGLVEVWLLWVAVHSQDPHSLIVVISTAATIKWCALLLALGGIPATVGILVRILASGWRYVRALFSAKTHANWWSEVWEAPDPPESDNPNYSSWTNAYNVPGAKQAITNRYGERVQTICLSGGGVRSACVAMGAMQRFSKVDPLEPTKNDIPEKLRDKVKLMDTVDYVISVSGGGFSAGARLLAVQVPEKPLVSERFEQGSPEFDHFRRGSSYIADSPGELVQALAVVLKNLLGSITILFTLPALLGWVFGYLLSRPAFSFAELVPVPNHRVNDTFVRMNKDYLLCLTSHSESWWAVAVFAILAAALTSLAMIVEMLTWQKGSEKAKLWIQRLAMGSAVFALLVFTAVVGLPALMRLSSTPSLHASQNHGGAAAAVSGLVGLNYLAAIAAMAWKKRALLPGQVAKLSWWKRLLPPGVVALVLVVVTLAVLLVAWLVILGCFAAGVFRSATAGGIEGTLPAMPSSWWLSGLLAGAIIWISTVDIASLSLNPFYRYRLGRTFAVRRVNLGPGRWDAKAYDRNEFTWLQSFGHVPSYGPKFIFAAAATITGEDKPAPGLNAVSYVIGGDHIGGPDLGWLKTPELDREAPPRIKRDLTVLTAVSVSGAAFASAMGRSQKGFEKLLAVSGARLGTWLPNPNFVANLTHAASNRKPWPKALPTIRGAGYYYRELLGFNYKDARLVQVTDGGHYENLGLVEALRRRSRLIICIDGGGDTPPLLSGLADAMRLAKYELGVTIKFNNFDKYQLGSIAPGSGEPFTKDHAFYSLNSRLATQTVAAAVVTYPPASGLPASQNGRQGWLIFAKAVLCEACPQWLLTYAASNEVFPHDPTSDQWFNEAQFAAYTELGRIMGRQALACLKYLNGDDEEDDEQD